MSVEYIKRKDVIEKICNLCRIENDDCSYPRCTIINTVKNIPAADVMERKHGKWIPIHDKDAPYYEKSDWIGCSECHNYAHYTRISDKPILSKFCPNCGAQMESEDE